MTPSKLWEVVVKYDVGVEYCETAILFAEVDDSTAVLPGRNLANQFKQVWMTTLLDAMSAAVVVKSIYVRKRLPGASIPYERSVILSGTRDDRTLPPSSVVCIGQFGRAVIGAGIVRRRYNHWSGISRVDQNLGILNSNGYTLWTEVAKRYLLTLESPDAGGGHWQPCLYTKPDIFTAPILYAVVRDAIHTRRTRQVR